MRLEKLWLMKLSQFHKELGSDLYEIVYEVILAYEIKKHGLTVERQVPEPIEYDGIKFDEGSGQTLLLIAR